MITYESRKYRNFFDFIGISALILLTFLTLPVGTGDTTELIKGSNQFFNCLKTLDPSFCGELERFGFTPHLVSALFLLVYPNNDVVIVLWSILSYVSFLFLIFILKKYFYKKDTPISTSNIFFVGTIFSPIIAYSVYSFSESFFILVSIYYLLLIHQKKYYLASLLGIFAIAYKDNAFLILIPLAIAILLLNQEKIKSFLLIALSWLSGLLLNLFFNFLRFNRLENSAYQEGNIILNTYFNISNFFGVWFSPSGGALGYFFILPIILIYIILISIKNLTFFEKIISLAIFTSLLLTTLNLAIWFSPFGWIAWGPRLILPSLILFIFVSFIFLDHKKIYFTTTWGLLKNSGFFLVTYLSFLSAAGFLMNPGIWFNWRDQLVNRGVICEEIPSWNLDPQGALSCNLDLTWTLNSLPTFSVNQLVENVNNSLLVVFLILLISVYFLSKLIENVKMPKDNSSSN